MSILAVPPNGTLETFVSGVLTLDREIPIWDAFADSPSSPESSSSSSSSFLVYDYRKNTHKRLKYSVSSGINDPENVLEDDEMKSAPSPQCVSPFSYCYRPIKTILHLPYDTFENIVSSLTIDEEIPLAEAFADTRFSFLVNNYCDIVPKHRLEMATAIGIRELELPDFIGALDDENERLIARFALDEPWECIDDDRHKPRKWYFSSPAAMMKLCPTCQKCPLLVCVLRNCPRLESLDLRGVRITRLMIRTILAFNPRLVCLQLLFASFDSSAAFIDFLDGLAPRLHHVSLDNQFLNQVSINETDERGKDKGKLIADAFGLMLKWLSSMREAKIVCWLQNWLDPDDFRRMASIELQQLKLYFVDRKLALRPGRRDVEFEPADCLTALAKSEANISKHPKASELRRDELGGISHLLIESNCSEVRNLEILKKTRLFRHLRGLNFNARLPNDLPGNDDARLEHYPGTLRIIPIWPLRTLSINLDLQANANQILEAFLIGRHPERAKLSNLAVSDYGMQQLRFHCETSLSYLRLVNVYSSPDPAYDQQREESFDFLLELTRFPSLRELRLEYFFGELDRDLETIRELIADHYRFTDADRRRLIRFIDQHRVISEVREADDLRRARHDALKRCHHCQKAVAERGVMSWNWAGQSLCRQRECPLNYLIQVAPRVLKMSLVGWPGLDKQRLEADPELRAAKARNPRIRLVITPYTLLHGPLDF